MAATNTNVPVLFTKAGTGAFVAIKATHFGFSGTLTAKSDNAGSILVQIDGAGEEFPLPASASLEFDTVDLNRIAIKGNGYNLIVCGNR